MNEDIKILEQFLIGNKYCEDCTEKCVDCYIEYEEVQAIKRLVNGYKEMEEMLKHRIKYTHELEQDLFENARNYVVPKSDIQNKIDKLEHEKFKRTYLGVFLLKNYENQRLLAQIEVLQELLKEGE